MMIAYLVMAGLIVSSLVYLFGSLSHQPRNGSSEAGHAFYRVRREEVAQEQEAGRLTASEVSQLLLDIDHEMRGAGSRERFSLSTGTVFARWTILGVLIVTVLGSVSLYQQIGYSKEVIFTQDLQTKRLTPEKITDFLMYRSARYDRVEDWYYLANDYLNAEQYQNAVVAFETALKKLPITAENRVSLLVEYAQAIFYANDGQSSDKMSKVVNAILQIEPNQPTALDLKGVSEFTQGNYLGATLAWQEAIRYNRDSKERLALLSAIGKARQLGRIDYQQVAPIITDQLVVKIKWDTSKVRWQQDDVLLVYAVLRGQTMPIAIQKIFPEDLERPVLLTNLDALMPTATLADTDKVDLVVKLANINDDDLTKGQIIGMKRNLLVNRNEIFVINVAL